IRSRIEVGFAVEAHADSGRKTAAAARTLHGVGLRYGLHSERLQTMPSRVAIDARKARVDDEANSRHRQRGLRDVGREHDARRRSRLEDALLAGRGQARVERQDLVAFRSARLELAFRVANPALAG